MDAGPPARTSAGRGASAPGADRVRSPVMGVDVAAGCPLLLVVMTAPGPGTLRSERCPTLS